MDISIKEYDKGMHGVRSDLPICLVMCDFDAYFTVEEANEQFLGLLGFTAPELSNQFQNRLTDMIHEEDCLGVVEKISKQYLKREPVAFGCRILCKDGSYREIQFYGGFIRQNGGDEKLFGVIMGDSDYDRRELGKSGTAQVLSPFFSSQGLGFNAADVMVFEWDIASDNLYYSYRWNENFGLKEVKNQVWANLSAHKHIHADDVPVFMGLLKELQEGTVYATAEFRFLNGINSYIWCQVHAVGLYDQSQKPIKAMGILFDIDSKKQATEELRIRAERDALTGLYNRKETEKQIKGYLDQKPDHLCALFMIDTDNFKQINDTKGHMLGDVVLTEIAYGMRKIMCESDVVGRIGGDEFTIFMKNVSSRENAAQKAADLLEMCRHLFENEKHSVRVTCSIGVSLYPDDGSNFQMLYRHADEALYQAKSNGKDGFAIYDKESGYQIGGTGTSSLGAVIDSQAVAGGGTNDLAPYIFNMLYKMEDMDQAVNLSLEMVGKRFDVSRAYIFELGEEGDYYRNTYEWCNQGIVPQIDNLQHLDFETAGDYKELVGEDSIYYCRNTHVLPPLQKKLFEDQGIHSFLQCALWDKGQFAGFIGFDECTGIRLWTQEEVNILSQISELLDFFLQKKKVVMRERKTQLLIQEAIQKEEDYIYVIRANDYKILHFNNRIKQIMPKLCTGVRCHETLYYAESPCAFCPLHGNEGRQEYPSHAIPIKWDGEDAYIICFHKKEEINTRKIVAGSGERAERAEITDCIQWLTSSEYLEDSIVYVMEIIREYYQSDRVYIIEVDEENGTANNTYEVCREGVLPQIDNIQNLSLEAFSFWMKQFAIRDYIKIDDIEELGTDRRVEYEILKEQEIKSLMALPIYIKERIKGFLGVDNPKINKANFHYLEELSYYIQNEISKNAMQKHLEKIGYEDSLTGLENRNSYRAYCDDFSRRWPEPVGVIFMDINGLKKFNEVRGHVYGDMLITHVADVIKHFFPDGRKFRLSGDEFLIVTEEMPYDKFKEQLDLLEARLSSSGHSVLSIGTTWSDLDDELEKLVNKADRLMHISKQRYYKEVEEVAAEKLPLLKELTDSILNRQYMIYLQPKVNMETQRVDRAEVLVRYREKDGSISSPIKFIPLLESEGLISNIDFFVMDEVCKLLTRWKNTEFENIRLSLNFSRITLFDKNFFEEFWKIFRNYDLKPEQLEVEITETQEALNKKQMVLLLNEFKEHHFKIALDDFGVEYSSYEFLMMADFDVLKIDKGIIQKYEETARGKTLLRHIVNMSHSIGIKCCAEGVETRAQFDYMKEIGCDYVQGYLIDKPVPVEQFEMKYMDVYQNIGNSVGGTCSKRYR